MYLLEGFFVSKRIKSGTKQKVFVLSIQKLAKMNKKLYNEYNMDKGDVKFDTKTRIFKRIKKF